MSSLWRELRQRNVFRVTVTYVIVAVAVGGAADVFLPGLGAPGWVLSSVLALLILGLPLAGVLAWAYELTPEGVKRTAGAGPSAVVDVEPGASVPAPVGSPEAETEAAGEAWAPDPTAIAVLPFANLSEDPADEDFSDGVTEDILTHLTEIADLHVIGGRDAGPDFVARSALEADDGSQVRIEKIYGIIEEWCFGIHDIHDISRTELDTATSLPRFNMPLELGIFLGAKRFGAAGDRRVRG